jgi:hypothetical protein
VAHLEVETVLMVAFDVRLRIRPVEPLHEKGRTSQPFRMPTRTWPEEPLYQQRDLPRSNQRIPYLVPAGDIDVLFGSPSCNQTLHSQNGSASFYDPKSAARRSLLISPKPVSG